jgi:hypothetical protein
MKKGLFLILICLFSISSFADNKCDFVLNANGTYTTVDGKDYVILKVDSTKAEILYNKVKANVTKMFKNPQLVMSVTEPTIIKVRYVDDLAYVGSKSIMSSLMGDDHYNGYVDLVFEFKDGAIKISAPVVEDELWNTPVLENQSTTNMYFSDAVKKYFKKGKRITDKKKLKRLEAMEYEVNYTINKILDLKSDEW